MISAHGTCIRWYLRKRCARVKENVYVIENIINVETVYKLIKCILQIELSISLYARTHLFPSYHPI